MKFGGYRSIELLLVLVYSDWQLVEVYKCSFSGLMKVEYRLECGYKNVLELQI